MNKALKEKLLFITGGAVAIFGLVVLQQNFPSSLDSSKLVGQAASSWSLDNCPEYQDINTIIKNGNFSDGPPDNTPLSFNLSELYRHTICGWQRNFSTNNNYGVKHYDGEEQITPPFLLNTVSVFFPDISNDERYIGLIPAEHFSGSWGQTHDYLVQNISGAMESGQDYTVSFEYYTVPNDVGTWIGPEDLSAGIAILFLDENQFLTLESNNNYSSSGCSHSNSSPLLFCGEDRDYSSAEQFTQILENNFGSSIDFVYLSPNNELSSTDQWSSFSANFTYPIDAPGYITFVPVGYSPEYDYSNQHKVKTLLLMDNVSIFPVSTCGITFQGEGNLYYSNLDGEYVQHNGGSIDIESIGNQYPENVDEDSFYLYSPAPGVLNVKAPINVQYTDADILELFSLQGANVISAISFSGSNFWIEYECLIACSELQEDFNQDGIVDQADVEAFLPFFGQSCSNLETCQFDLDNDGIITVQDMMILIGSVGEQCGVPISAPSPDSDETNEPENTTYDSQGNFVKPAKIPGLQKPYNYIVNTKFLNTKQTTLRIEQFFPSNMILRGLYSSTKNISLVSKEGIVRFFNLGKTTSVKSYLYLEADPEICKIVSQNKKAYAELVSYGLCK